MSKYKKAMEPITLCCEAFPIPTGSERKGKEREDTHRASPYTAAMKLATELLSSLLAASAAVTVATQQNFYDWPHQRVALANSSIHFRYAGSGPPVLLVHGVPEHSVSQHIPPFTIP